MDLTNITKRLGEATTALAKADNDLKLEIAGAAADAAGLVDPTPTSDLVGAGISIARGDYWGAALSTVSMVPYLGDAVAKPVKAVRATKAIAGLEKKVAALTKTVNDLKKAKKEAEAVEAAAKEAKLAKEADAAKDAAIEQEKTAAKKGKDCEDCKSAKKTEIKNGYEYSLDETGRVTRVKGKLTSNPAQIRNSKAQLQAGGKDRLSTDDGGHFIGRRFDGPIDDLNHFAQDMNLNRSAYKKLENEWQTALKNGQEVIVDIRPTYPGSSLRPSSLDINYTIDKVPFEASFKNRTGGK
ncbi:DNA/RNA non-specific endonuclease [Duganella sp. CF517]|uniref:DNA/RNA non-specific endonuclease n=1 Tax=Duganella sp. CF517 TaxID=1881038 RepID=UPI0008D01E98|nr:DNA/RNA non-specific endonuclease [Duganella sp. CF517]SEN06325.1 DNA/RNA non-specific endonuclease [Duganella sp. CF517]